MPELPDVQVFKEYVDATALHQRVTRAVVHKGAEALFDDVSATTLRSRLQGVALAGTRRHGKHLFLAVEGNGWLRLHFGMTGDLDYFRDPEDHPDHARLSLCFDNGYRLVYRNERKFGEIGWVDAVDAFVEERDLGPDPWNDLDGRRFCELLEAHRGALKPTLMNQEIIAGLGNVYVDEVLFQARLHPQQPLPALDGSLLHRLYRVMTRVLRHAVDARARPRQMPRRWLIRRRESGRRCTICGGSIEKIEVGGRPTYFCPEHQPLAG